jgi:hypothetical protein
MAKGTGKVQRYPREMMQDVFWSFRGPKFRSQAKFTQAVHKYCQTIGSEYDWRPEVIVLRAGRVRICPDVADVRWDEEPIAELTADNGESFTAGELLFKTHNAFVALLRDGDHVFFEGFTLARDQQDDAPPLYDLDLGS